MRTGQHALATARMLTSSLTNIMAELSAKSNSFLYISDYNYMLRMILKLTHAKQIPQASRKIDTVLTEG